MQKVAVVDILARLAVMQVMVEVRAAGTIQMNQQEGLVGRLREEMAVTGTREVNRAAVAVLWAQMGGTDLATMVGPEQVFRNSILEQTWPFFPASVLTLMPQQQQGELDGTVLVVLEVEAAAAAAAAKAIATRQMEQAEMAAV